MSANIHSWKLLIPWLKNNEWKHIALTSRIKNAGRPLYSGRISNGRLWLRKNDSLITGALFISRYGVLLPVYDPEETSPDETRFFEKVIHSRENNLFSVIGMESRVLNVEKYIRRVPSHIVTYRMLIGNRPVPSEKQESSGLMIHRATVSDFDKLWGLEKAYQLEEVLSNTDRMHERSCQKKFLDTLKNQIVYYALLDDYPVAKAGTNARGYCYHQIGGVYVVPAFRKCGFGTAIMNKLLSVIVSSGHRPCLFVKQSNSQALGLYTNLDFRDMGAFRISYYK